MCSSSFDSSPQERLPLHSTYVHQSTTLLLHHPNLTLFPVARTPTKLTNLLLSKGVPSPTLSTHLTITEGNVLDPVAVRPVLCPNGKSVDLIVSGIGMVNLFVDNTLCTEAMHSILNTLADLRPANKPLMLAISTTGITAGARDVPILLGPLYHVALVKPHKDKREMERVLVSNAKESQAIRGAVIVRPTLLTSGASLLGEGKVKVGTEEKPAVGYTISREDVGRWIFEDFVDAKEQKWVGEKVSLTY